MTDVDCMTCIASLAASLAAGIPAGGSYVDPIGITHSTVRSARRAAVACSLLRDRRNHEEWSTAAARWVPE